MTPVFDDNDTYAVARKRMISEQIISRHISDKRVIDIMSRVPRHEFVDDALKDQAYTDGPLSIGEGQTISQPFIVALMTETLLLSGAEKVLEIGTGCGYQTLILAMAARQVYTIERIKSLGLKARTRFKKFGLKNIVMRIGDGSLGWAEAAPFDRILIACAAPQVPDIFVKQLSEGGIMVIPVSTGSGHQDLLRITRKNNSVFTENLGACHFVKLVGRHGYQA
ncbi:MAG: protein-L-isoaspartate(D-aspartate) O-methyltransferase [Deltaproteobacteria bacterium]|nr:protein-L-isoaspartate(D-aspartate) O-methyltransferase [Deltaproteobacteria bacterium]